ncbi:MAG: hypothetical protein P0Y49_15445 [Candidatus Pedobacter colombiensis]|uniref:Uncharacterized protein n=1 Tax=Candidatus Pedobacter colombiensis TaxID=3121371 RepID=A0AAJ5W5Y7_9SPHI|nr:hypothetical protein [Pedobacter sp.]WEK18185.1 MAG: hypothetical protein P0Y49_15445 [Pedobacter sp.]
MSIKGKVFRFISNHLKDQLTFDDSTPGALPSVKWIDKYNSQQLRALQESNIKYPAIFIGFHTFRWTSAAYKVQKGRGVIRIYTVFENNGESHLGSTTQEEGLQFMEFNEAVFKALEGLSGVGFSPLNRTTEKEDMDHDRLIVTITDYQTELLDVSSDETQQHEMADPELIVRTNSFLL